MQTVIVTPDNLSAAQDSYEKHAQALGAYEISGLPTTDGPRPASGEKVELVITGTKDSISSFFMMVALNSSFPRLTDPNIVDMRDFMDRFHDLGRGGITLKDGEYSATLQITWPEYEQTEINLSEYAA